MSITNWQAVQTCTGLQIRKQWKPDPFPAFHDFPSGNLCKFSLLGEHPQSPLNATCGVGCAFILNAFTYGLLRNLHRSSISHKRKKWKHGKSCPWLFMWCVAIHFPTNCRGVLWATRPQVTKMPMVGYNFIPSWDEKLRANLAQRWKRRKQKNENHFDIICVEVESLGFMLVDRLATRQLRYFLKINFVPNWDEVLRCSLHQSKAWRFHKLWFHFWTNCPEVSSSFY